MNTALPASPASGRATAVLLLATFVWGLSFVIVKQALASSTPLAFTAVRFAIGAALLTPFAGWPARVTRAELGAGVLLGGLLAIGFATQTVGLLYTTPARSAFITACSAVLAPLFAAVRVRERPAPRLVLALGAAGAGIYLLTAPERGGLNRGDLWTLATALAFAAQIVAVTELSRLHAPARLAWLEVAGTALGIAAAAILCESPRIAWSAGFGLLLVYAALPATALGMWWQLAAQRRLSTAKASLVLALEPVFAALASWVGLGEHLSVSQWTGGMLVVAGMLAAEPRDTRR